MNYPIAFSFQVLQLQAHSSMSGYILHLEKMWVFFTILVCKSRTKQIQIKSNIYNPTVIISKHILPLYLDTFEIGLHFTIVGSTVVSTLLLFHSCIILCRSLRKDSSIEIEASWNIFVIYPVFQEITG